MYIIKQIQQNSPKSLEATQSFLHSVCASSPYFSFQTTSFTLLGAIFSTPHSRTFVPTPPSLFFVCFSSTIRWMGLKLIAFTAVVETQIQGWAKYYENPSKTSIFQLIWVLICCASPSFEASSSQGLKCKICQHLEKLNKTFL